MLFKGIIGNVLVVLIMLSSARLRGKPINRFMMNQSVIDMMASFSIVFRQFYSYEKMSDFHGLAQQLYCKLFLVNLSHIMLFGASGYNLVALSFERHSAIMNPLLYDEKKVSLNYLCTINYYDDRRRNYL